MSVLILSRDAEAAESLRGALTRSGQAVRWAPDLAEGLPEVPEDVLVVLLDAALAAHRDLRAALAQHRPWTRLHLLADPREPVPAGALVIRKPFDAGEVAALLVRDLAIAEGERNRRGLARELEHSERLAEVGRLAASMAHEISNPLSVVAAAVPLMADAAARLGDAELEQCAGDVQLAVERIRGFVDHVCGFTRRAAPELRDASLTPAVDLALRMVRPRAEERGVNVSCAESRPVQAPHDMPRLSQAVLNLLSNAIDAAAEGGGHVRLELSNEGREVVLAVDDDGPGVAPDIAGKLFEPFATTKAAGRGTGLGLSITRQIVHDHGGSVRLTSRAGGGTRAELRIPAFRPEDHVVLVVDDDAAVQRALLSDLRRDGFQGVGLTSSAAARQWLSDHRCSAVIADAHLSDGTGDDVLREAAERVPGAGRLLVSADRQASGAHADARIGKPWNQQELIRTVRSLCLRRPESRGRAQPERDESGA